MRYFFGLLLAAVLLCGPASAAASAVSGLVPEIPQPFGGTIVAELPCLTAPGFFAIQVLEPPLMTINTYIVSFLSPFLYHIPLHPGQQVLGHTLGSYSCIIDLNPKHYLVWRDPVSVFYGSSL